MLRHLIQPLDFTTEEFDYLFRLANKIIQNPENYLDVCKGKLLASLFLSLLQEQDYLLSLQC